MATIDSGLCPKCGGEEFTIALDDFGTARVFCSSCEWGVKPEDLQSLVETPHKSDGSKLVDEWVRA